MADERIKEVIESLEKQLEREISCYQGAKKDLESAREGQEFDDRLFRRLSSSILTSEIQARVYVRVLSQLYVNFPEIRAPEDANRRLDAYNLLEQYRK
ncbi:hypothetical protein COY27_05580 [Candidatus Woesearchaeota archaeon CG_4_10_14_0_2_um_filter_33_13]|nr:MAG: hypothetical protein COY27_05580 [Candidatus Woesearchaeota archaeon CG_4_10_14_0_2_um_filter_33_13]